MKTNQTDKSMRRLYAALLILALAAFVLSNLCAHLAQERFPLALDLTESKLYALSPLTGEVCQSLASPVTIHVVSAQEEYPQMLREMLRRYGQLSEQIQVEYVDPYRNPVFLEYYAQSGIQLSAMDILVSGPQRSKPISYNQLLITDNQGAVEGIDLEQQISSALLYVSSEAMPQAAFITGHNERPTTALRRLFESNSFETRDVSLLTGDAQDASIIVIAAPTQDYAPSELAKLQAHLSAGGRLMAFIEPSAAKLPNLEDFLAQWGIAMQSDLVFEPTASAAGNPLNLIPMYASHEINAYFADHPVYVVMPSSRSLSLGSGAQALLVSTTDAYRKHSMQYESMQRAPQDASGRAVLAAIAQQRSPAGETGMMFVAGSRMLYADDLMGATTYANSLFLSQVISHLYTDIQTLSIAPKTLSASPLPITTRQSILWGVVLVGLLPLGALGTGLVIAYRRRRL